MKKFIVMLILAFMISGSVLSAGAQEVGMIEEAPVAEQSSGSVVPTADKIVVKLRVYQGKKQYRHWNETRGYWVEPDWITYG